MAFELWSTDKKFTDSPDTGWPECTCSRCGKMIKEGEMPLRMMPENENAEYRFCMNCQEKYFGIIYSKDFWNEDNFDF